MAAAHSAVGMENILLIMRKAILWSSPTRPKASATQRKRNFFQSSHRGVHYRAEHIKTFNLLKLSTIMRAQRTKNLKLKPERGVENEHLHKIPIEMDSSTENKTALDNSCRRGWFES